MTADRQPVDPAALAAWCQAASGGDAAALEALLAAHHSRFAGYALRKIGVDWQSRIEVEDLLQEAYVDVFAHIGRFEVRDGESFYRWVTQIIENRFLDMVRHWRRKKRDTARVAAPAAGDASWVNLLEQCGGAVDSPSRFARRDEALGMMLSCMAQLSDEYRSVVRRVYLEQQPYEQIATELGRSSEAVRRMATRAVEKMRECMGRGSRYLSHPG